MLQSLEVMDDVQFQARRSPDLLKQAGLGWEHAMPPRTIRSSVSENVMASHSKARLLTHSMNNFLPVDYEALIAANQLDVQLYHFAKAVQVRHVRASDFLFLGCQSSGFLSPF